MFSQLSERNFTNLKKMLQRRGYNEPQTVEYFKEIENIYVSHLNESKSISSVNYKFEQSKCIIILIRIDSKLIIDDVRAIKSITDIFDNKSNAINITNDTVTSDSKMNIDANCTDKLNNETKQHHVILIHGNNGITPSATDELIILRRHGLYVETFAEHIFNFDAMTYDYEVVSDDELYKLRINVSECNKFRWNDIQRRLYNWPEGTVVRRLRQRGSLCRDYCYRIVIPDSEK